MSAYLSLVHVPQKLHQSRQAHNLYALGLNNNASCINFITMGIGTNFLFGGGGGTTWHLCTARNTLLYSLCVHDPAEEQYKCVENGLKCILFMKYRTLTHVIRQCRGMLQKFSCTAEILIMEPKGGIALERRRLGAESDCWTQNDVKN
jgi:hypothetical protein